MTSGALPLPGTFVIERDLASPPSAVFAAFVEPGQRARWVRLPGKADPGNRYDADPGSIEVLRSTIRIGDRTEQVERRTRLIEADPGRLLVFGYEAIVDERVRWASLVTVILQTEAAGTRLTWTEQYALLVLTGDGTNDVAHLRGGTELHLNGLGAVLRGGLPLALGLL